MNKNKYYYLANRFINESILIFTGSMKHFYYFSDKKLKYIEIRNFPQKLLFLLVFFSVNIALIFFSFNIVISQGKNVDILNKKNSELVGKINGVISKFEKIDSEITELALQNNNIRLKLNLEPITNEERKFGIGGSIFNSYSNLTSLKNSDLLNKVVNKVEITSSKLEFEKSNYSEIENRLNYNKELFNKIPAIAPINAPIGDLFGMRFHPILKIRRMHKGIDFRAPVGTKIYAPGNGVVEYTGYTSGFGKTIIIDHGYGYKSLYAHLNSYTVNVGDTVERGDMIAYSGNSGRLSTGPHLHYEVEYKGIAQNPINFIYENLSPQKYNQLAKK